MTEYVTTNIRMPKDLYRQAKLRALKEEKSLAQVIRESMVLYLAGPRAAEQKGAADDVTTDWEDDSLWLIGTDATEADVTDGSIHHDLYLYGPLSEAARTEIKE